MSLPLAFSLPVRNVLGSNRFPAEKLRRLIPSATQFSGPRESPKQTFLGHPLPRYCIVAFYSSFSLQ